MNFAEFAASRKSVRGFTKEPVSRETIEKIMDAAKWAPSSYNTQTWKVHVVSGDVLDKIREGNTKNTMAGKPHVRDFPYKEDYEGTHRRRQIDVAIQLFEAMGIERDDKEKRTDWMLRGFRQFDAPVSLVLTYDKNLEPAGVTQFGLGALAYGIVLAAWDLGLGCVINGQGIMQSDVVHEHANIPDDEAIMICIALGYPDDDFAANDVRSVRADNSDFVKYIGFED
ncbi:MAG TPA: nitroreductase [Gammaproteobacteria bacterium]|nr:nitroreductase [Gammaproteobacteria bacterium]